jgi:hypothetical protein
MDLIERLFGVFPDGGNGALELVLIVLSLLAGGVIWIVRHAGRSAGLRGVERSGVRPNR